MMPRSAVLVVCAFTAACSADTFAIPDSGEGDASTDTGVDVSETSVEDARVDVSLPSEGGLDSGPPTFSCLNPPAHTIFCDDFDTESTVNQGWTAQFALGGASVAFDSTTYHTSPRSAAVTMPQGTGSSEFAALYFQDTNVAYATSAASAQVRIHALDMTQQIPVLQVGFTSSKSASNVAFQIVAHGADFFFTVAGSAPVAISTYVDNEWYGLRIEMTVVSATATQGIAYIDDVALSTLMVADTPALGTRDIEMGIISANGEAPMSVNFDDFLYRGY